MSHQRIESAELFRVADFLLFTKVMIDRYKNNERCSITKLIY